MEDYVTYELAVKLKEKGFDYKCLFVYNKEQIINPEIVKAFGELSDDGYYELTKEGGGKLDWSFVYINEYQLIQYRDVLIPRETIKAPTISQVLKWLREEKAIHLNVVLLEKGWYCDVWCFEYYEEEKEYAYKREYQTNDYNNYEQAALAGIEYILNYLL